MATDREVAEWRSEWREIFEDMAGVEIWVVLRALGRELARRRWLLGRYEVMWILIIAAVAMRYEDDRLTDSDLGDIPF